MKKKKKENKIVNQDDAPNITELMVNLEENQQKEIKKDDQADKEEESKEIDSDNKINDKENLAEEKEEEEKEVPKEEEEPPKFIYQNIDIDISDIEPLKQDSKYNIFFILTIKEDFYFDSKLDTYEEINEKENLNHPHILLFNEEIKPLNEDKKRLIIFQVPLEKKIPKLWINLLLNKKEESENKEENGEENKEGEEEEKEEKDEKKENIQQEFTCQIEINEKLDNVFYFNNLIFENSNIYLVNETKDTFFSKYFNYFNDEKIKNNKTYKKGLIQSIIDYISKYKLIIYMSSNNLFILLKLCLEYKIKIKNFDIIQLFVESDEYRHSIDKEYILDGKEIDNLYLSFDKDEIEKVKKKLSSIFVKLYSNFNEYKIYLKSLIQSKNSSIYIRDIFKLLLQEEIKVDDLNIENKKEMNNLKKSFLEDAKSKDEINFINKLSKGLIAYLEFIKDNCNLICEILEKNENKKKSKEINYLLDLPYPDKEDNIEKIY